MKNIQIYLVAMVVALMSLCNLSADKVDLSQVTSKDLGFTSEREFFTFIPELGEFAFRIGMIRAMATWYGEAGSRAKAVLEQFHAEEIVEKMARTFNRIDNPLGTLLFNTLRSRLDEGRDQANTYMGWLAIKAHEMGQSKVLPYEYTSERLIWKIEQFIEQYRKQIEIISNLSNEQLELK